MMAMRNVAIVALWMIGGCVLGSAPVGVETETDASSNGGGTDESGTSMGSTSATTTAADTTTGPGELPLECQGAFETSWSTWQQLRDTEGRPYVYTRVETLHVGDYACSREPDYECNLRTTITVDAGVVVSRELAVTPGEGALAENCPEAFVEPTPAEVGTNDGGAPPRTIDELYQGCCDVGAGSGGFGEEFGQASYSVDAIGVLASCSDLLCDDCGCGSSVDYAIEGLAFAN